VTVRVQSSAMGRVRSEADVFLTVFPGGSALAGVQEQVSGGGQMSYIRRMKQRSV